jgi:ribosomal protein S15P/S13E
MAKQKIIHCMYAEKFIAPYLNLLEKNFNLKEHLFLIRKDKGYPIPKKNNIFFLKNGESKIKRILFYIKYLNDDHVEKIILHGILNKELWFILFFHGQVQSWLSIQILLKVN